MERTTSETAPGQTGLLKPSSAGKTDSVAGLDLNILPPADHRSDARFVATRMAVLRRPPALAMATAALSAKPLPQDMPLDSGAPNQSVSSPWNSTIAEGFSTDLDRLASLDPDLLAWRVTEMSSRLSDRPDLAAQPEAAAGLRVLGFQALMFEHLQILKSAAAEGNP